MKLIVISVGAWLLDGKAKMAAMNQGWLLSLEQWEFFVTLNKLELNNNSRQNINYISYYARYQHILIAIPIPM